MTRTLFILLALFLGLILPPNGASAAEAPQKVEDRFLPEGDRVKVEAWIENLEIPWSLLFFPDGRALVSERPGKIGLIKEGKLRGDPYATLNVAHVGEGGLMGLCLHPQFQEKPYLYAMHTYQKGGDRYNRVVRFKDLGDHGEFDKVILDNIPGGRFHNGGRIGFGPDGFLYVTAGETFKGEMAQNLHSLGGKILRVTEEGEIPGDNPFKGSPIYSYGHRNPQGLSWHPETGDLFESEHGPSGESLRFAHDEVNVIVKGGNYGWPEVIGAPGRKPYIDPLVVWKKTTPPSGMTFYNGALLPHLRNDLFVATLKSESLIRIKVRREGSGYVVTGIERWFAKDFRDGKYGRIRDVVVGPDGALYFLTNNRDGRGSPKKGDDKIYRITGK
jgi:glucose/arabinose dehydrogenase